MRRLEVPYLEWGHCSYEPCIRRPQSPQRFMCHPVHVVSCLCNPYDIWTISQRITDSFGSSWMSNWIHLKTKTCATCKWRFINKRWQDGNQNFSSPLAAADQAKCLVTQLRLAILCGADTHPANRCVIPDRHVCVDMKPSDISVAHENSLIFR